MGLEILNTKVARRACAGRAPGKHSPSVLFDGQLTRRFTLGLCVVLVCLLTTACVWSGGGLNTGPANGDGNEVAQPPPRIYWGLGKGKLRTARNSCATNCALFDRPKDV